MPSLSSILMLSSLGAGGSLWNLFGIRNQTFNFFCRSPSSLGNTAKEIGTVIPIPSPENIKPHRKTWVLETEHAQAHGPSAGLILLSRQYLLFLKFIIGISGISVYHHTHIKWLLIVHTRGSDSNLSGKNYLAINIKAVNISVSNPIQYSCLGNSVDREACWATVHGVAKESDTT